MATDFFYLGPSPSDEDCSQVGEDNFRQRATKEMKAYIDQLYRLFPDAQDSGVEFKIKWFNHDFGSYGEVIAQYDESNDAAFKFCIAVDNAIPYNWDEEAMEELKS